MREVDGTTQCYPSLNIYELQCYVFAVVGNADKLMLSVGNVSEIVFNCSYCFAKQVFSSNLFDMISFE